MRRHSPTRVAIRRLQLGLLALPACLMLAACNTRSMADLEAYVAEVKARPGPPVEPINIDVTWSPPPEYDPRGRRDPFKPFESAKTDHRPEVTPPHPDPHPPQDLEAFPLDSLRMVGTLKLSDGTWGLVQSPIGMIHRVKRGHYLGQNNGKVIDITESKIDLHELVVVAGAWHERNAALGLTDAL